MMSPMRHIGRRQLPMLQPIADGALLAESAGHAATLARLGPVGLMPKGVYRYKTHTEANRHQDACLAQAMARLARERGHG